MTKTFYTVGLKGSNSHIAEVTDDDVKLTKDPSKMIQFSSEDACQNFITELDFNEEIYVGCEWTLREIK